MAKDESGTERELLQQRAELVDFGLRAAEGADLVRLLHDAAEQTARSLEVKYVKVLEYLPVQQCFLVRAGVGWDSGVVGRATIGADSESPAGYALQTGQPVIANDLDREQRFKIPELLRAHGVKSAVNVIIRGKQHAFGVLEADSRAPRIWTADDVKFLQAYANILSLAIDQARLVDQNALLAAEKDILLRELQHRVMNNNQQLIGLINLQLGSVANPEAREHLQKVAQRIMALTSVNQQLRGGARPDLIDVGQYLLGLIGNLLDFQAEAAAAVRLETEVAQIEIATERAQALGLIVNEFLTNSFKYAFRGRGGTFSVTLTYAGGEAQLVLGDDGPGMPQEVESGLGMKLIDLLCRQIEAEAGWQAGTGARLNLRFPIKTA
jgi:two-component sensor histidine kinase